jgi:hypothetical protein
LNTLSKPGVRTWRKKILVYPSFQLKIIAFNFGFIFLEFLVIYMVVQKSFFEFLHFDEAKKNFAQHSFFDFVKFQSNKIFLTMVVCFLICFLLSSLMNLYISQRMAGPLLRMRSFFIEISKSGGQVTKLKFRDGDYFDDLPEIINSALTNIVENKK